MQRSWGREQAGLLRSHGAAECVAQAGRRWGWGGGQRFARNFREPGDQFRDNMRIRLSDVISHSICLSGALWLCLPLKHSPSPTLHASYLGAVYWETELSPLALEQAINAQGWGEGGSEHYAWSLQVSDVCVLGGRV